MTKRLLLIFILLGMAILSFGQDMSVKSFYLAETDLTANTPGTMVHDQNGNVCALIKVETTLDGFSFDVGILGTIDTRKVGGEMWVYVPFGIRKISISHPQLPQAVREQYHRSTPRWQGSRYPYPYLP